MSKELDEVAKRRSLNTWKEMMGEDLLRFMNDDDIFEIRVNPDAKIWVSSYARGTYCTALTANFTKVQQVIFQTAYLSGQVCGEKFPILAAELPDGSRFQGFLPRVTPAPAFLIRKHLKKILTLDDYVRMAIMTPAQREAIADAVRNEKNIIVAGETGCGKTTLLNAILHEISQYPDRVVILEDTPELSCAAKDCVKLCTTVDVDYQTLLKYVLRFSPDRIVLGEVRHDEALSLLDAWQTGHGGGCSSIHSNSAVQTLHRLEQLVTRVSLTPQKDTVGEAVDLVVYIKICGNCRRIEDMIAVEGFDHDRDRYLYTHVGGAPISPERR